MSKKTLFSNVTTAFVFIAVFIAFSINPMCGEGYDPLLQITHQIARPDIYIVMDVSGSMAWDVNGRSVGVDSTGTSPTASWSHSSRHCRHGKCKTWTYKLTINQTLPSRMATVKNTLGNSVTIITPWETPSEWDSGGYSYITNSNWSGGSATVSGPSTGGSGSNRTFTWTVTTHSGQYDPGEPFDVWDTNGNIAIGTGGESQAPVDLVGITSDVVNWGLIVYSDSYGGCTSQTLRVAVDSNDTGDVSAIEDWLRLHSLGGQNSGGGTPTRGGLREGKDRLETAFTNDPKKGCGRTFGVILVTDGESNSCNPYSHAWSNCDTNYASNYTSYPAGIAEDIWNLQVGSDNVYGRTWVIGVSNAVGRCELNVTAYMGRTDANSPNGDAGFDNANDPYLPASTGDTSKYDTSSSHGDYAYFATSSTALYNAFASIVASIGAGDYTTSAPTASSATSTGTISLLATAQYPSWKGHLYCYDITQDPAPLLWDAGDVLSDSAATGYVAPASRKIYTWDASNNLVAVTASNLSTLRTAATAYTPSFDSSKLTTSVIDFIRGNDGSGTGRTWRLGSMINTTPAIIREPEEFTQGQLPSHASFENTYSTRTPVCWVGSDDGMFHAFRLDNGSEVMAILPPNMLATQVDLYNNYVDDPTNNPVGEPQFTMDHVYGAASSPRYLDLYYGSPHPEYHTVMILTEGPGGQLMAGLDVTSIVAGDTNYALPEVIWTKTHNSLSNLYDTWSVPAVGCRAASGGTSATFGAVVGSGFNDNSTSTSQVVPRAFTFDPTNGSSTQTLSLGSDTSHSYVGNQAFAHSVYFEKEAKAYYPDNIVNLGLQADLKGIIWFLSSPTATPTVGIDATTFAGQVQPIYYPPAVSGYYVGTSAYDIFAFGSGTFYEQSTDITGTDVGTTGYFTPTLYLVAKGQDYNQATTSQIASIKIKDLFVPDSNGDPTTTHLGNRSQLTAAPALFIPISNSSADPVALFLIYDPDSGLCGGTSYVLKVTFDIQGGGPHVKSTEMYSAGEGAASGFAVVSGTVVVAKSHIGAGGQASVNPVSGLNPTEGMSNIVPTWYRQVE